MEYITKEQYEQYTKALDYNYKIIDIRLLTNKYILALNNYIQTKKDDISSLKLIVDAFCYLSDFNLYMDTEELVDIVEQTKRVKNKEYCDYQIVTMLAYEIVKVKCEKKIFDYTDLETLNKLLSTIHPIKHYEKQNGNVKTLMNQLDGRKSI